MLSAAQFTNPRFALSKRLEQIQQAVSRFQLPPHPDSQEPAEHRVAVLARQQDFECAILGGMGFGNDVIRQRTGLSNSQIYYRLKAAKISRRAYREGRSPFALAVRDLYPDRQREHPRR